MDKKSERSKDHKSCDDTDIGTHTYGPGNKRDQLDGLWGVASKEVVGLPQSRILTNNYCKEKDGDKPNLIDEFMEGGPPLLNISKPNRVF
jgi:hypothetical protein